MCMNNGPSLPTIGSSVAAGVQVASSVAQYEGQKKQHDANEGAATAALHDAWSGLTLREGQEQAATGQSLMGIDRAARSAKALAAVTSGEAGVSGVSVDAIVNDLTAQELTAKTTERSNLQMTLEQLQQEKLGAYAAEQARIAGSPAPNPFLMALQIGSAAVQLGQTIFDRKHPGGAN